MVLREFKKKDDWLITQWQLTYKIGWKGVLLISEAMFPYLEHGEVLCRDQLESETENNITEKVANSEKRFMSLMEEESAGLTIRGMSKILKCPFQMRLFNQTYVCEVSVPAALIKDFDTCENKYEMITLGIGQILNSAEILGHVWMSKEE
ncbi:MAG: hypothetical protein ACI4HQ_10455 [Acetatifactor sp.]